jgi:hypothetical protein
LIGRMNVCMRKSRHCVRLFRGTSLILITTCSTKQLGSSQSKDVLWELHKSDAKNVLEPMDGRASIFP